MSVHNEVYQQPLTGVGTFENGVFIPEINQEPIHNEWGSSISDEQARLLFEEIEPIDENEENEETKFWNWYYNQPNSAWRGGVDGVIDSQKIWDEDIFIQDLREINMEWNDIKGALLDVWRLEAEEEDMCLEHQISSLSNVRI